ncbi:MAG: recombinase family protein [Firmicutes bacterium]|nr:recombinase family protein [Bacillota bacterium]
MAEYFYARVSTKEQNLDRQFEEFMRLGADKKYIFYDKQSGKDFDRKAYNLLVGTDESAPLLREGDLLTIYSIDRLGRNYTQIQEQWKFITQVLKANIRVIDMPLLNTAVTKDNLDGRFVSDLVLQIISYVAEKERENIKARQRQGIDIAKKQGKRFGRPSIDYPPNWSDVYDKWKNKQITAVKAMEMLDLKCNTFYNLVKKYEKNT